MRKTLIYLFLIALFFSILGNVILLASNRPLKKGDKFPPINVPVPRETKERNYLGLSKGSFFRIPEIKAEIIIIEIFSLYCPPCIKMGPKIKELYENIENDPDLRNKIKIIGIGAGDSLKEVEEFKRITDAPFPLFSDQAFSIHNAIGEVRTPHFIAIRINPDRTHQVIYSESGGFKEPKEFLKLITTDRGLN